MSLSTLQAIKCDSCEKRFLFPSSQDEDKARKELEKRGWKRKRGRVGPGETALLDYCPRCAE